MSIPEWVNDRRGVKVDRNADLMGDDIIGNFLSEEVLDPSNKSKMTGDKFQRFIHDQESFQNPRIAGRGLHGVVVLVVIKDVEYALKVVRYQSYLYPLLFFNLSNTLRSSKNGNNPDLSSIRMRML